MDAFKPSHICGHRAPRTWRGQGQREAPAQGNRRLRQSCEFEIAADDWFYDPAVSGADPIETRPGFNRLLDRIEGNGVRVVIMEDASRFARDLMTQELGILGAYRAWRRVLTSSGR